MKLTDIVSANQIEAERIMTICNSCRYCEGHCAVFPAMEKRIEFKKPDLEYLANLCHNCGSCYHHCQYADPHEFQINVPQTFSDLRHETYTTYAFPSFMGKVFENNGIWATIFTVLSFIFMFAFYGGTNSNVNNFYDVIPHNLMVNTFGSVSIFVLFALVAGIVRYWRALSLPSPFTLNWGHIITGINQALTLKYLDGGSGDGCTYPNEAPSHARRIFHHLTFYGFMLCFAATSVGTVYHYVFDWMAPYGYISLPKALGITGGIGLIVGPIGLLWLKQKADKEPKAKNNKGMDIAFLVLLLLTSVTGLLLMIAKGSIYIGPTLIIHLSFVLALFITLPYGKFVHGFYRLIALIKYAEENSTN